MQRSPHLAFGQRGVGVAGALAGGIDLPGDDCIERRVIAFGAGEVEIEQFEAADAAVTDLDGQLSGGTKGVRVHLASSPSRKMPAYQRFGADANRACGLCWVADVTNCSAVTEALSPDPRIVCFSGGSGTALTNASKSLGARLGPVSGARQPIIEYY